MTCLLIVFGIIFAGRPAAARGETQKLDVMQFVTTLRRAQQATDAKQWNDAAKLWETVTSENPVTGEYWLRLAEARQANQDFRGAIAAYETTMTLGVNGLRSTVPYAIAECYARLTDRAAALSWLEKAMALGYRYLDRARKDPDLQILRDSPRFRDLTASVDVSRMSRVEGWRYDVRLLAREFERRRVTPYLRMSREDLHRHVAKIDAAIPKLSDGQVVVEIMRLMAAMGDGHTAVYGVFPNNPEFNRNLPVYVELFSEGLYITAADTRFSDLLGAQILRFGALPAEQVMAAIAPLAHHDNSNGVRIIGTMMVRNLGLLAALGLISDTTHLSLTVKDRSGATRTVDLPGDSAVSSRRIWDGLPPHWTRFVDTLPAPLPLYLRDPYRDYWFEFLPESRAVYVAWNHVHNDPAEPLPAFFERVSQFVEDHAVDKLILDLRWNNGGDTTLVPAALAAVIQMKKINQPGKLFVITSSYRTYSAAQNAATMIERFTHALFVGDTTASSPNFIGEDVPLELPYSKMLVSISDLYWETSWPTDYRTWIPPLLYTPRTFASYAANRDPALEAALEYR